MQKNWRQWWLGLIIVLALVTRFYNLWDSLQFQGDQGRDAIVVSRIFTQRDLVFIGPVTSVGNMYLGPLYYYFMLPFLWLSYPSPIGPVYAVAALGVLTVYLIYRLGRNLVGENSALLAATLYALSANFTLFARFSWNPNPAPIVSLVTIYATWLSLKKSGIYWWLVGLGISVLIQLHYVTLLAAGAAVGVWIWQQIQMIKQAKKTQKFWQNYGKISRKSWIGVLIASLILISSLTPLVLFDWKHQWLNAKAFQALIFKDKTFTTETAESSLTKIWSVLRETDGRSMQILAEINLGQLREFNRLIVLLTLGLMGWALWRNRRTSYLSGHILILWWLVVGILGTAAYQHTVFDHYIAYLFPISALMGGVALGQLYHWQIGQFKIGKIGVGLLILGFASYNLPKMPLKTTGWTVSEIRQTSQTILDRVAPGEKYNLVLLSESHDLDGQNYRYF